MTIEELMAGLQVFRDLGAVGYAISAEHDVIYVNFPQTGYAYVGDDFYDQDDAEQRLRLRENSANLGLTFEEIDQILDAGWSWDKESDRWKMFA